MNAGSCGSGGLVSKGVRGLVDDAALLMLYSLNPPWAPAGALFASEDPAALILNPVGGFGIGNGVLLNDGNTENAYC